MEKLTVNPHKKKTQPNGRPSDNNEFEWVLTNIFEKTSAQTGQDFFYSLVEQLAMVMGYKYAMLAEFVDGSSNKMQTLAVWSEDKLGENLIYDLDGTPCGELVARREACHIYDHIAEKFPCDLMLETMGVVSYMGVPVFNNQDELIGILVVLDDHPIPETSVARPVLTIFASRAGAEMTRLYSQRLLEQSLHELKESRQALDLRNQIAKVFLTFSDRSMYSLVLEKMLSATGGSCGVFGYIDENKGYICPNTQWDPRTLSVINEQDIVIPEHEWSGLWQRAIAEKKSIYQNQNEKGSDIFSMLCVPVIHTEVVIGNLILCKKTAGFNESDRQFLESITSFVAPVLHARLQRDAEEEKRKQSEQQRRQLENQLLQRGKMEAIGSLAGGIAHDFNNILMAISGYTELALMHRKDRGLLDDDLNGIITASNRAGKLVNQILTFSSKSQPEVRAIKVQLIVQEVVELLLASMPASISMKTNIYQECPAILADSSQLHQVILNLCTNAYQAMRPKGGTLELVLQPTSSSDKQILASSIGNQQLGVRDYIRFTVKDTGAGMTEEIMKKIFEPYYTTKKKGEGTGLGLAMVNKIVTQLSGAITVKSQLGKGTCFDVYMPVCQGQAG